MAADSSMGFHQGVTTSFYNHHMLSFQSGDVSSGNGAGMVMASRGISGGSMGGSGSSSAGLFLSPNTDVVGNMSAVGPSQSSSGDVFHGVTSPKYKFVMGSPADWSLQELAILKEGLIRYYYFIG